MLFNKILLIFIVFLAELKMDVLREREVKDSLERQLSEEQKLRGELFYLNLITLKCSYIDFFSIIF